MVELRGGQILRCGLGTKIVIEEIVAWSLEQGVARLRVVYSTRLVLIALLVCYCKHGVLLRLLGSRACPTERQLEAAP